MQAESSGTLSDLLRYNLFFRRSSVVWSSSNMLSKILLYSLLDSWDRGALGLGFARTRATHRVGARVRPCTALIRLGRFGSAVVVFGDRAFDNTLTCTAYSSRMVRKSSKNRDGISRNLRLIRYVSLINMPKLLPQWVWHSRLRAQRR
jgi:hypothetical protein